ncbi:MAG: hypothetical protein HQL18_03070 [Candidatus Omnitrophica bacterium]|nr:hypothetical protein [Candidatus Omnitrophota bacterium]
MAWTLGALLVLYFSVFILGPVFIRSLFQQGQVDLLSRLTFTPAAQSLEFYLGRSQELFWGPLAQVIGSVFLIILMLGRLKESSARGFFFLIAGFLLVTKWSVLTFPPYGDTVIGAFAEALWLAQHNFNYVGLAAQPGYAMGGQKVYLVSFFPTYLAALMKLFPNVKTFLIVNHKVFFKMAAAVVLFVREIARRAYCLETANLLALLVLSWPVFQSQTEAINMEMPCLLFAMLASYGLVKGRTNLAGGAALLAVMAKGTGAFACAAFAVWGMISLWIGKDAKARRTWLVWGAALLIMAALVVAAKYWIKDSQTQEHWIGFLVGWQTLKYVHLTYIFAANAVLSLVIAAFDFWRHRSGVRMENVQKESWRVNLIQLIFVAVWFLLFLNFATLSARYRVVVYPFFLFTLAWSFSRLVPWRLLQTAVLVVAILAVQANSYGYWNQPYVAADALRLEENLQYRNDAIMQQRLARTVEEKYRSWAVVAPMIVAQEFAIPDFGYVKAARDVYIYRFSCMYGPIHPYPGMAGLNLLRTIYVALACDQQGTTFPYPLNPQDRVLETVEWGSRKAVIFMGGVSIDLMKKLGDYVRQGGVLPLKKD